VALASAVAVIIVVGGITVLLNGPKTTTLEPAAPGETAETDAATETLVIPTAAALPPLSLDPANEVVLSPIDEYTRESDVSLMRLDDFSGSFTGSVEIVVVGRLEGDELDPRLYAVRGVYADTVPDQAGHQAECVVVLSGPGRSQGGGCSTSPGPIASTSGNDTESNAYAYGRAPEGTSVVVLDLGSRSLWQRTSGGYFLVSIDRSEAARIAYVFYDAQGNIIDQSEGNACSGALHYPSNYLGEDLPDPVVRTIGGIIPYAQYCAYDDLAALGGDNFNVSFGGDDPSTLWTMQEEGGEQPMYALMKILDMPYGTVDLGDQLMYVWPSAAAFDGPWDELPETDRQALLSLYTDEDLQSFADFGGYLGYRIGITAGGDWSFFVAGD
jgi:hypothetical protein